MALAFAVHAPGLWEPCDPSSAFIFALVQEGFCREVLFQMHLGVSSSLSSDFSVGRSGCPALWTLCLLSTVEVAVSPVHFLRASMCGGFYAACDVFVWVVNICVLLSFLEGMNCTLGYLCFNLYVCL